MYFYSRYLIYSLSSLSLHHSHVHDVGRPIPSARPQKHDARFQSAQFHERRVSRPRLGLGPIHRVHEPDDVIPGAIAGCIPRAALAPVSLRGASAWRMATDQPTSLPVERFDETISRRLEASSRRPTHLFRKLFTIQRRRRYESIRRRSTRPRLRRPRPLRSTRTSSTSIASSLRSIVERSQ